MLEGLNIYWIGGSPCCGKSTFSEMLIEEFGFEMYKCDDHIERYAQIGASKGSAIMQKLLSMSCDETWLRDVAEQVADEFTYYREALPIMVSDLGQYNGGTNILVEGAAILPEFIKEMGIDPSHYICMVPTAEFQRTKYSQRDWVDQVLHECSDKARAFDNWMNRDIEFAKIVKQQAKDYGQNLIIVDGSASIETTYAKVKSALGL